MTTNSKSKLDYKDICNVFGCSNSAEKEIDVNAGKFGIISLNVCSKCIDIFKNENTTTTKVES
jgi:hypothetical protein